MKPDPRLEKFLQELTAQRARELAELKETNRRLRIRLGIRSVKWGISLYHRQTP